MNAAKSSIVPIIVLEHARIRARERFPGFKAARIIDEVREALTAGRVSGVKPSSLAGKSNPEGFYVWTADGERIYGLAAGDTSLFVRTTMRAGLDL